jgi:hypothetical protein
MPRRTSLQAFARILASAVVLLALGAAANLGANLAIYICRAPLAWRPSLRPGRPYASPVIVSARWPYPLAPDRTVFHDQILREPTWFEDHDEGISLAPGLPARSEFWSGFGVPARIAASGTDADGVCYEKTVNIPLRGSMVFPTWPLWRGIAINTLAYAALLGVLWQTALKLRATRRRRNGWCTTCGYDLAGTSTEAPCPECGSSRTKAAAAKLSTRQTTRRGSRRCPELR